MSGTPQKRCWRKRLALGGLTLALLLAGCTDPKGIGSSEIVALDEPSEPGRARVRTPSPSAVETDEQYADATMVFVVRNRRGALLSDIPLVLRREGVRGRERLVTGRKGAVKIVRPPGIYRVSMPAGCIGSREVNETEGARIGIIEGRTHHINLKAEARRRFVAGPPLTSDIDAPWPAGRTIDLAFGVFDRCKDRDAPGASYSDLRWRASGPIEIVDAGRMRADDASMGSVKVRCTGEGDAKLWLEDRDDRTDRVDILAFRPPVGFNGDALWCGA